jgi:hypothetical protein
MVAAAEKEEEEAEEETAADDCDCDCDCDSDSDCDCDSDCVVAAFVQVCTSSCVTVWRTGTHRNPDKSSNAIIQS